MKILELTDLLNKKIIIINNLNVTKTTNIIKKYINQIDEEHLVIFLKETGKEDFMSKVNCRLFSWAIFEDSAKKKYSSHHQSRNFSELSSSIKKKNIVNFLNNFFVTDKQFIDYAVTKEKLILDQKKYEIINIYNEISLYNNNLVMLHVEQSNWERYLKNFQLILIYILYSFYSIFFAKNKRKFSNYQIGLRVYNSGIRFSNNDLKLDWLVDGNILKNKTLLILEDKIDNKFKNQINNNNYNTISARAITPYYSLNFKHFFIFYPKLFFKIFFNFFSFLLLDINNKKIALNGLKNYILWSNISSLFNIKIYMSYNDYSVASIYRNIILKKKNCKAILYTNTHSEAVFDKKNYFNVNFSYNFFDKEYHWSKLGILMSKINLSKSSEIHQLLPFSGLLEKKKLSENKSSYIACFSSQLGTTTSVNSPNEHLLFLNYMYTLLLKYKKIKILFKPKYKIFLLKKNYPNYFKSIQKLIKTKRFFIKQNINSKDLIKQSSICISMAFASTSVEALSLLRPSFYVNFQNSFKNNSFSRMKFFYGNSEKNSLRIFKYWYNFVNSNKRNSNLLLSYSNQLFDKRNFTFDMFLNDMIQIVSEKSKKN
jgi:hypothetical protein